MGALARPPPDQATEEAAVRLRKTPLLARGASAPPWRSPRPARSTSPRRSRRTAPTPPMSRPTARSSRPRCKGLVAEVLVAHNQAVRAAIRWCGIDPEEFDARVAAASADLPNAQAAVGVARAALVSSAPSKRWPPPTSAPPRPRSARPTPRAAAPRPTSSATTTWWPPAPWPGATPTSTAPPPITAPSDADHSRAALDVSRDQADGHRGQARRAAGQPGPGRSRRRPRPGGARSRPPGPGPHRDPRADRRRGRRPPGRAGRLCAAGHPAADAGPAGRSLCDRQLQGDPDRSDAARPAARPSRSTPCRA